MRKKLIILMSLVTVAVYVLCFTFVPAYAAKYTDEGNYQDYKKIDGNDPNLQDEGFYSFKVERPINGSHEDETDKGTLRVTVGVRNKKDAKGNKIYEYLVWESFFPVKYVFVK